MEEYKDFALGALLDMGAKAVESGALGAAKTVGKGLANGSVRNAMFYGSMAKGPVKTLMEGTKAERVVNKVAEPIKGAIRYGKNMVQTYGTSTPKEYSSETPDDYNNYRDSLDKLLKDNPNGYSKKYTFNKSRDPNKYSLSLRPSLSSHIPKSENMSEMELFELDDNLTPYADIETLVDKYNSAPQDKKKIEMERILSNLSPELRAEFLNSIDIPALDVLTTDFSEFGVGVDFGVLGALGLGALRLGGLGALGGAVYGIKKGIDSRKFPGYFSPIQRKNRKINSLTKKIEGITEKANKISSDTTNPDKREKVLGNLKKKLNDTTKKLNKAVEKHDKLDVKYNDRISRASNESLERTAHSMFSGGIKAGKAQAELDRRNDQLGNNIKESLDKSENKGFFANLAKGLASGMDNRQLGEMVNNVGSSIKQTGQAWLEDRAKTRAMQQEQIDAQNRQMQMMQQMMMQQQVQAASARR